MRNRTPSDRYRATAELRRQFALQGRKAAWAAAQIGVSKSKLSKVMSGTQTIRAQDARVLAALLGVDFSLLFEVPIGTDRVPIGPSLAQVEAA